MTIPESKAVGEAGHTTDHNKITRLLRDQRQVHVADYQDGVLTDKQALTAALDYAETLGGFGEVVLPMGVLDVGTGFSMSGYSSALVGQGCSHETNPTGSVLKASSQTGPVLDMTGFVDAANFRGRTTFRGFALEGSNVANPSKVKTGLFIDSLYGVNFENIVISRTGGPCIKAAATSPGDACYFNTFSNVVLINPVSAGTNDVPYMHLIGSNANRFFGLGLYSRNTDGTVADVGASGAIVIEEDASFAPELNVFYACWTENLHLPASGAVIHCQGNGHIFSDWQFEDTKRVSGVADTCVFRFEETSLQNYGGNLVRGIIPGYGGSATEVEYGVDVYQDHNVIQGVKGFNGKNVRLNSGVGQTTVELAGGYSTTTNAAVVDNSGETTNIITDNYLQKWQMGLGVLTPYSDGASRYGVEVQEASDATAGTLGLGNQGVRLQALPATPTYMYATADVFRVRNIAANKTPLTVIPNTNNPVVQIDSTNGANYPARKLGTAGGFIEFADEAASDPSAPAANGARLFTKDNGSGKTQLVVRFASGATQVIATEP